MKKVRQIVKPAGIIQNSKVNGNRLLQLNLGAGDGARTRDDLLGRQAFYH